MDWQKLHRCVDKVAESDVAAEIRSCVEELQARLEDERKALWRSLTAAGVKEEVVSGKLHAIRFARVCAEHPLRGSVSFADLFKNPNLLCSIASFAGFGVMPGVATRLSRDLHISAASAPTLSSQRR